MKLYEDPFKFQLLYYILHVYDLVYLVKVRDQWLSLANS